MSTEEVAQKVVDLVRKQAWREAVDTLYDKDIVSVEARTSDGSSPETRGIDGMRGKVDWRLIDVRRHERMRRGRGGYWSVGLRNPYRHALRLTLRCSRTGYHAYEAIPAISVFIIVFSSPH